MIPRRTCGALLRRLPRRGRLTWKRRRVLPNVPTFWRAIWLDLLDNAIVNWARCAVVIGVSLLTGSYFLWAVRASGTVFHWTYDLGGYYDYLGRGLASGHLYVPIEPSPKLLALENPYDPAVDESLKMGDMVLYNRHYYLYFGGTPAALLFAPWRIVTGHDLPENFALFLICFGGYLFSCAALLRLLKLAGLSLSPGFLAVLLVALGFCTGIPFLLNRVWAYEIAIGSGYFCLSAAIYFLARSCGTVTRTVERYYTASDSSKDAQAKPTAPPFYNPRHPESSDVADLCWLAASGLMFGLAVGCRPHLIFAAVVAVAALAIFTRERPLRKLTAFAAPILVVGALLATYNYKRFGNPLEFGFRYQLSGPGQNRVGVALQNVTPGLYYMLLNPPEFGKVFPWVHLVIRNPFPFPPEYFIEPTIGALWLSPLILALILLKRTPPCMRIVVWTAAASSMAILIFLMTTHLMSQRYEVDFLPLAVFAAVATAGLSQPRRAITATFVVLVGYSVVINLAAGIVGPYDDILGNQPARYVHLAKRLSPVGEYRPMLNPEVVADLTATFTTQPPGFREPLLAMGTRLHGYALNVEHQAAGLRIVSQSGDSKVEQDIPMPGQPIQFRVSYAPASAQMTVNIDGHEVLTHAISTLVTAPSQVLIGKNHFDPGMSTQRFTGSIQARQTLVRETR